MRSTSFSPLQAAATENSAYPHATFLQYGPMATTLPASAYTLRSILFSSLRNTSTTHFLSARLPHLEQSGSRTHGSNGQAALPLDGEIPERPKRRLPSGHLMRFSTSTATTPALDDVLIEPVERWSDNQGVGGRLRIKPNVLLYRVRGAHPNAPVFSRRVTVSSEHPRVDVTEATDGMDNRFAGALPTILWQGPSSPLSVPFSPDFKSDEYPGSGTSKLCSSAGYWSELSFWQCHRNAFDVQELIDEQATSPNPVAERSSFVSQLGEGSVLLPVSSPLRWLLTGNRPQWLLAGREVDDTEYVEPLPVPMPLAIGGEAKAHVAVREGRDASDPTNQHNA